VHRMLAKMGPAVFSVAAAQISLLINTTIAAGLAAGAVSALQYADRLMELPTALLGVALGTILLPGLAKANTEGDSAEYSSLLDWGLRLAFLLALPAAVALWLALHKVDAERAAAFVPVLRQAFARARAPEAEASASWGPIEGEGLRDILLDWAGRGWRDGKTARPRRIARC